MIFLHLRGAIPPGAWFARHVHVWKSWENLLLSRGILLNDNHKVKSGYAQGSL